MNWWVFCLTLLALASCSKLDRLPIGDLPDRDAEVAPGDAASIEVEVEVDASGVTRLDAGNEAENDAGASATVDAGTASTRDGGRRGEDDDEDDDDLESDEACTECQTNPEDDES